MHALKEAKVYGCFVICSLGLSLFIFALFHMYDSTSVLGMIDLTHDGSIKLVQERIAQVLSSNERVQLFSVLFVLLLVTSLYLNFNYLRSLKVESKEFETELAKVKNRNVELDNLIGMITSGLDIACFIVDLDGKFVWCNDQFKEIFELSSVPNRKDFEQYMMGGLHFLDNTKENGGRVQVNGELDQTYLIQSSRSITRCCTVYTFYPINIDECENASNTRLGSALRMS